MTVGVHVIVWDWVASQKPVTPPMLQYSVRISTLPFLTRFSVCLL